MEAFVQRLHGAIFILIIAKSTWSTLNWLEHGTIDGGLVHVMTYIS